MEFEGEERRRFLELLEAEWEKGTGAVDVSIIVGRMREEDLNTPDSEIGAMIVGLELAEAAAVLAEDEAEKNKGKAVVWKVDAQQLEQMLNSVR